MMYPTLQGLM